MRLSARFVMRLIVAVSPVLLNAFAVSAQVAGVVSLTSFGDRGLFDGDIPNGPVVFDKEGNLYGVTFAGGQRFFQGKDGIVYELSKKSDGKWTRKTVFEFVNGEGSNPIGALAIDGAGNLFGTTQRGGIHSGGLVYELSPSADGSWRQKVLFNFPKDPKRVSHPYGVVIDKAGNLYGGVGPVLNASGIIFKLTPQRDGGWTETTIYTFDTIQGRPSSALTMDDAGNLYGVTVNAKYGGVVFSMTLPKLGQQWNYATLHTFPDKGIGVDGLSANSIVLDAKGNAYGTSERGGTYNQGTVFEVPYGQEPDGPDIILYNFSGGKSGYDNAEDPQGVTFDRSGNLVGVTAFGGHSFSSSGRAFELLPQKDGSWRARSLHDFGTFTTLDSTTGENLYLDGVIPWAPLVLGADGDFYGVTMEGGYSSVGAGTVFKLVIHSTK